MYRDGRHRQAPKHSVGYRTADLGKSEEVKQMKQEESKICLVENVDIETESPKKTKSVSKEDSVICIKKKDALGLC